jgi:hypothetical protein
MRDPAATDDAGDERAFVLADRQLIDVDGGQQLVVALKVALGDLRSELAGKHLGR